MPKETRIKKSKRTHVRQQDVFEYGPKIEPAARVLQYNTSVRAQNTEGGAAAALLQGLGIVERAVPAAVAVVKGKQKESKEAGKLAAGRGEPAVSPDSWVPGVNEAYIEGYQEMTGAGEGYLEIQTLLQQHAVDNAGEDLETFSKTQDMELSKYFAGRTDAFVKGALPGAISLQRQHQSQYLEKVAAEFEMDKLAKTRSLMDANTQQILATSTPEELATNLRMELNHAQDRGKQHGHHRSVSSTQMVNIIGKLAVESGNADLMRFAYELGSAGKIRVIDNDKLAARVSMYEKAARAEAKDMANQSRLNRERQEKDLHSNLTSGMAEFAGMVGNPNANPVERKKAREVLRKTLWEYSNSDRNEQGIQLTQAEIEHFQAELDQATGMNDSIFAATSVPEVEAGLKEAARHDPLSLTAEVMEKAKAFLKEEDYVSIRDLKAQTLSAAAKRGFVKSESHKDWDKDFSDNAAIVNKLNPLSKLPMYNRGPERHRELRFISDAKLEAFMKANNGRRPDRLERRVIFNEAIKEINDSPEFGLDKMGRPLGGLTGNGNVQSHQGVDNPKPGITGSQDRTNRFADAAADRDAAIEEAEKEAEKTLNDLKNDND